MAIKFETRIFGDLIKFCLFFFYFVYGLKTKTGSFYDLIRPLFFVLVYGFNFQQGKSLQPDKFVCSYCFVYSYKNHNIVLITKTALTKLLENTLDESSKLKNMSDERLGCLTKSVVSQTFYRTMSDLSKTLISHPGSDFRVLCYS